MGLFWGQIVGLIIHRVVSANQVVKKVGDLSVVGRGYGEG